MDSKIEKFVESKSFALVGVSSDKKKFGNYIVKEMVRRGYNLFPVHPSLQEIEGIKCYKNLKSVSGMTKGLIVSVKPANVASLVNEAVSCGFSGIWLQQGSESKEAIDVAEKAGLQIVAGKCILMYSSPVKGIHKFHQFIANIFGKY
jgi:predicted CoA-binding protein